MYLLYRSEILRSDILLCPSGDVINVACNGNMIARYLLLKQTMI